MLIGLTSFASELNRSSIVIDSTASYYADRFHGRKTASGERFDQNKLSAAYNGLPLGTKVLVTRISGEDTYKVELKINDRTAKRFSHRIDLSKKAAKELKILKQGTSPVTIEIL